MKHCVVIHLNSGLFETVMNIEEVEVAPTIKLYKDRLSHLVSRFTVIDHEQHVHTKFFDTMPL